jgi:hypothetical protein
MMTCLQRWFRGAPVMAAWLAIGFIGRTAVAQENPPPTPSPPAPGAPSSAPSAQPVESEYTGRPGQTSAGGSERKLPPDPGLFPGGPMSILVPPIEDFEKWTSENLRLDLGFRAAFGFQQASAGPGERTAASQDYRIYGTFHLFNWEEENKGWAGNIYTRFEYRAEMFTKITPFQINTQIGTLVPTTYGFDEHVPAIVQLYYEQFLFDGGLRLRGGKLDPDDYFNLGRFADDYRYFYNTLFSDFPASNHPSGGLGWNAQWYITPEWTLTGGMTDVRGKKTTSGFETVDEGRFLSAIDVTYSPTIPGLGKGNYRVGFEHRDSFPDENRPQDNSYYINIDQEIAKDIAPFIRWGHGTGNSTGVEDAFSVGLGIDNPFDRRGDAFGFGFGFDTASNPAPGGRDTEYVNEVFYRFQLTRAMQWMVGGQLIFDPINAPGDKALGIFEMRLVIDF